MKQASIEATKTLDRFLAAYGIAQGDPAGARAFVESQEWSDRNVLAAAFEKGIVGGLDLIDIEDSVVGTIFLAARDRYNVLGQLPGVRHVPLFTRMIIAPAMSITASAVARGAAIPLSAASFTGTLIGPDRLVSSAGLMVLTGELMRAMGQNAQAGTGDALAQACALAQDQVALSATAPGLLFGAAETPSTGADAAAIAADIASALSDLTTAGSTLRNVAVICSPATAVYLSALRVVGGALAYPNVAATGGTLSGLPVVTTPAASGVVLIDGSRVVVGDGRTRIELSRNATLEMDSAPGADSIAGTPATMISLFQTDSVAIKGITESGWLAAADAVAYISGTAY
jgi:hypothetical protein